MAYEKMKGMSESVQIPQALSAEVANHEITIKAGNKMAKRKVIGVMAEKKDSNIVITSKKSSKNERKLVMSYVAHLKNMIRGLEEGFTYKLKVCAVHFPMTVTVDKNANVVLIKNFLGEKKERRAKILPGVEVQVKGEEITVTSHEVENAGQTAANIEKATLVKNRDRRVFQDGIFLTERRGEKI
jgi:large subunit ribosomal protein L6